jgi:uncharacterized SAM-binding protein YcdF (DUF218 family)
MNKHIVLLSTLFFLVAGGGLIFINVGKWLIVSEEPRKVDVIICLSLSNARLQKVVELFRQGYADKILVTYTNIRVKVIKSGVPDNAVLSLNDKHNSTYEEAMHAIQYMHRQNLHSAIIVSDPYHMYRAKWTYDHLVGTVPIQLTYTASESINEKKFWWDEPKSRRFVLNEIPKVAYYWIAHGLLGVKYDPQWVTDLEHWYSKMLTHF